MEPRSRTRADNPRVANENIPAPPGIHGECDHDLGEELLRVCLRRMSDVATRSATERGRRRLRPQSRVDMHFWPRPGIVPPAALEPRGHPFQGNDLADERVRDYRTVGEMIDGSRQAG